MVVRFSRRKQAVGFGARAVPRRIFGRRWVKVILDWRKMNSVRENEMGGE